MAIQKHNIYYDASKPESGIYYYAENGEQKELFLNNVLSGENGISAISAIDGNTWVIGITDDYKDNIEKIPGLSDNFVILSADVGNKLYVSATDNWDVLPYSGSTNISIHDHIIDFQNTANLIGDGTHIDVISSGSNIIVSALKDFVDEEYVDEAIVSSVSGKFDSSAFNTYSGIIDNKIDKLSNDFNNKLDISATNNWDISAYIAGNHISIEDHIISIEDAKNLSGDEKNITVLETDDAFVISGLKDFVDKKYVDDAIASAAPTSAVANKLDKSVFSAYSADIALQLNNISADKLDTSAFTAYSAHALDDYYKKTETYNKQEIQNALDEKQDNLTNEQLSAISSVSAIQSISANWLTEEDIEDFITEDEVESVSSILTAQTNYLSGIIDTKLDTTVFDTYTATALDDYYTKDETKGLINDLSSTVSSQLNNKLDTTAFAAYSGNINNQINTVSSEVDKKLYTSATNDWDVTPYSGINGIKVENHLISVSANYALSADVYSKSQIDDIIANFGGFQIVSEDAQGKPDVSDPSTKIIYLTLVDDDPAAFDKYREWIWTNSEWECIGIASIDLKDYAKTQDVIASANATSAWINNTFYDKTETSGKTEIQNALDTKLDTTAFNDYSDNIDDQLQALSSVKLDTSAFTAYSADIESQLDTLSAIKLDKTYSATVNEQLTAKLDTTAFNGYSAEINTELNNITADVDKKLYTSATDNWDYVAYSGGQNVSVVDHIIDISGTKSLSGDGKNIDVVELADTFIISATKDIVDKSYVDNNFVSKTDFGTYSGNAKNQIDSKLDISAFTAYSAHALDNYYTKDETSGKSEIQNALAEKQDNLTNEQLSAISSVSAIQSNTENWNAAYDTLTAYSADGKWLIADDITALATKNEVEIASGVLTAQTNYLSGIVDNKLDTTAFTAYSADVKTQVDSKLNKTDFDDYSAHALNDYYTKNETDAKITDAINDISATVSADYLKKADVREYTAGNNIDITNYVISGKDWSPELNTKVDNSDFATYSGNVNDLITAVSANTTALSANKLDTTAFNDYSDNIDTQLQTLSSVKLDISAFTAYSAHALDNYYTKPETNSLIDDLSATVSSNYVKNTDIHEYTAGNNIDITNYVVSGKDWTPELNTKVNSADFTAYSATVNSQLQDLTENKLDKTEFDTYSASTKTQIDSKLNKSDFDDYSAHALNDYYKKSETSGSQQIADALNTKLNKTDFDDYSAHALNDYYKKSETSGKTEIQNALDTKLNTSAFTAYSGNVDTLLNNISANTTALSANKLDISAFTAYSATAFNDYYTKSETDTKITNAINDISATVSADYLKKADVREYTAGDNIDITNYVISGKDWTPELNTKVNNTDFNTYSASTKTQIDSKLNKDDFNTYSAHADTTPYSGINGIKVENHLISVSANYALSADVYSKSEVDNIRDNIAKELAGLGFYDCKSDEIKANGEPDETVLEARELLSNNKIYLVKDNTAPVPDQYKEWIWDGTNWTCIGDTSISLVAYAKTQDVIASAIATSAWINDTFYDKTETSGKQQIQDALNTKLNTSIFTAYSASTKTQIDSKLNKSDFDDYSATALVDYYKKSETSGKTEIQNALNTKLDTTAFNDYTATALNDIASNSGNWNASYTALTANSGNWDNTYNTVTTNSGKWENSYTALTANSALWLKEADVAGFATKTELNNASSILINQDNYLSGVIDTKLDTTAFNAYSAHALDEYYKKSETSGKTEIQNALGTKLDTTAFNNYSANVKTQIDSKLTKNDFDSYSAAVDNDIDYISAAVSSIPAQVQSDWEEINTSSPAYIQNKPVDLELSAGDGISITEVNDTLVFAVSGNYADATEVDTYYGKKTNDVYYIKPDLPYDLYSSTATYNVGDKVVLTAGSGSLYSAKSAVTTPGAWSTNSGKFAGVSNVVFTAENEDITELYDGLKIALYLPSRLASTDSYLNINGLGDVELYKNNYIKLTSSYFPTSGVVIYFTYVSATNRWVWADYDTNTTYTAMVDAYVGLSASATNLSAACTNFSAKPGNTINVTFSRDYTAVSAKKFRAGTTTYQPLYLNGSATSNTNYFIPSGTWPVYYDGNNWYLWTDGSIQFSAIRGTVIDCVKYNDIQYAIGTANTAIGSTTSTYSVALGKNNSAYNSFVIGNYNKGNNSYIFGNSNSGINSYIFGYNSTGTESYLFGKDLSGKSWGIELGDFGDTCYPVIVGNKNATHTSAYFVVGCGNTLGNADAFIVSSNKVASAADFRAGNGVSLSSLTGLATSSWVNGQIADAITSIPAQVQSDWSATNTASPAYILNKPNQIDMQCGTYLDITSANNQITLDADISAISAALSGYANVQSDWSATNTASPAYIQNKPDVLVPVDSPAALGGISKPTNIMVVSALPASPDSATIYLVQGTMIGN